MIKICKYCGKEYKKKNGSYCSRKCMAEAWKHYFECIVCHKKFTRPGNTSRPKKFCSMICFHVFNKGVNNPAYRNAKLKRNCKMCGKEFEYFKGSSSRLYCSQECSNKSPERIAKMRASKLQSIYGIPDKIIKTRIRSSEKYLGWMKDIYKRDGYKCVKCGSVLKIEAHHIIPFSVLFEEIKIAGLKKFDPLFDLENGVTLCHECHLNTDNYSKGQNIPELRLIKGLKASWENKPEGYKTFNDYYNSKMETLIEHFKSKIE